LIVPTLQRGHAEGGRSASKAQDPGSRAGYWPFALKKPRFPINHLFEKATCRFAETDCYRLRKGHAATCAITNNNNQG